MEYLFFYCSFLKNFDLNFFRNNCTKVKISLTVRDIIG